MLSTRIGRWMTVLAVSAMMVMTGPTGVSKLSAQDAAAPATVDRSTTGGAQTLDDIIRRQRGEEVPVDSGTGSGREIPATGSLGAYGSSSDSEFWRTLRHGEGGTVSIQNKSAAILVQEEGEDWLATRAGSLQTFAAYTLLWVVILLVLFFIFRGRIRIKQGRSGVQITRFTFIERFGHWLLATSFIVLAITGLGLLFGREVLIPFFDSMRAAIHQGNAEPGYGKALFATLAGAGKWLHNFLAVTFAVSLVLVFFMWVLRNIPTWTDVKWFAAGGGLFSDNSHPHARKFNGGQKLIFWSVIIFGGSITASGLSLLFPNEFPMFSATFAKLNEFSEWAGYPLALNTALTSFQEMQYAHLWHVIISVVLIAIIIAHIYIGSVGMQGAFSAMGSGKVDLNWAREHHDLWVEKLERDGKLPPGGTPPSTKKTSAAAAPAPLTAPKRPDGQRVEPQAPAVPAE